MSSNSDAPDPHEEGTVISTPSAGEVLRPPPTPEEFLAVQNEPDFRELRRRLRRFVFPMTAVFLTWYAAYVLLATYARDLMATPVIGNINLGIILGLGQFVTTFIITLLYLRFANRDLDPLATKIRTQLEGTVR